MAAIRLSRALWGRIGDYLAPVEALYVIAGRVPMLAPMLLQRRKGSAVPPKYSRCEAAARVGNLVVLQWARTNGCEWDAWASVRAAERGYLDILQWAHANGCELGREVLRQAILSGHTAILQWGCASDLRWDEDICELAAARGNLGILQWARVNGYPWDSDVCAAAARACNLKILQWARANGCPWDKIECSLAATMGYFFKASEFRRMTRDEQKRFIDAGVYLRIRSKESKRCLEWIASQPE